MGLWISYNKKSTILIFKLVSKPNISSQTPVNVYFTIFQINSRTNPNIDCYQPKVSEEKTNKDKSYGLCKDYSY